MGGPETESLLVAHERGAMKTGMDNGLDVVRNCFALCCFRPTEGKQRCRAYWSRYVSCLAECWPHCLSVWCVFFCSLSVFPAILSMVRPVDPNYFISPVWFTDVTCFLFFNLFAMIGCIVCNWVQFPGPRYLWIPVWFRALVFIPFFLFCNFGFAEPKLPVLVANDHVYVLGIILFSFTNGYFASLAMMYAPRSCPPERSELTGMLAAFCLILGVCSGVYTSRGLVSIVL
ncbi:solute carrier family 29 (equilibrative nucleoside transporter), member 1/2/3 [Paragonimus westermani]|uniref:Solute carrier family 29 (Equilibrative nucleoside transporter), member 1/2/3 n=1 Tax=Paragonimus westermani TaxID=34504 RepID=A0A5J4NIM2_9TREM|nr:solute carrier family 29 (equilibrative nucleoside transporter), member 1/2/3 [Paragonimus westermani]